MVMFDCRAEAALSAEHYVKRTGIRVELGTGAERNGPLLVDVAERDAGHRRDAANVSRLS
jgi:hypothetical protein